MLPENPFSLIFSLDILPTHGIATNNTYKKLQWDLDVTNLYVTKSSVK